VITSWRIVDDRYADDVFSGEGARLHKGRWHSAGTRLVYTCSSVSLASLELLVRVPRAQRLPNMVIASCTFPDIVLEELDHGLLPANWSNHPPPPELQQIGTQWVAERRSAVLAVPSAVTLEEFNYLINPEHEDFGSVETSLARPFRLDLRLLC
jgi:RES domain-containing protein